MQMAAFSFLNLELGIHREKCLIMIYSSVIDGKKEELTLSQMLLFLLSPFSVPQDHRQNSQLENVIK